MRDAGPVSYTHLDVYKRQALQYSCPLIDLRSAFLLRKDLDTLIGIDGLHPTPAGYEVIWQQIAAFFLKFK